MTLDSLCFAVKIEDLENSLYLARLALWFQHFRIWKHEDLVKDYAPGWRRASSSGFGNSMSISGLKKSKRWNCVCCGMDFGS